jgi:hypothetical protein
MTQPLTELDPNGHTLACNLSTGPCKGRPPCPPNDRLRTLRGMRVSEVIDAHVVNPHITAGPFG